MAVDLLEAQDAHVDDLKPHPRNYNEHPDDQVAQIAVSLKQHGQYRNIVCAIDGTILAGHGVWLAAKSLDMTHVRVVRTDLDPDEPQALKLLAADNTLAMFSMADDRDLSELLKEIKELDAYGLDGTGFDDMMLANLVMITRTEEEMPDQDAAGEWLGMPDFVPKKNDIKYVIIFRDADDRERFAERLELEQGSRERLTWSTWWPKKDKEDLSSVKYG